jgi:hypothetical protein
MDYNVSMLKGNQEYQQIFSLDDFSDVSSF